MSHEIDQRYRKALEKYLKDEAARAEMMKPATPYDPAKMRPKAPLGCVVGGVLLLLGFFWLVVKLTRLYF